MKKSLIAFVVFTFVVTAHAQFFGGYADGLTSVRTGNNVIGPALRIVYDDFTFDLAGDIQSFDIVGLNNMGSPVAMYYEIRTGMSPGNGGTLLFSGTTTGATVFPLPTNGSFGTPPPGGGQYVRYSSGFPGGSPLHLGAGTYWIGLAPLEGFGQFDVASTQGFLSIGHPINNGNAFYSDSSNPALTFVSMGDTDFAVQIDTVSSTIPEPGTLALVGLGALGLFLKRRLRSS